MSGTPGLPGAEGEPGRPGRPGEPGEGGRGGKGGRGGEGAPVGPGGRGGEGGRGAPGERGPAGERGDVGPQPKLRWAPAIGYVVLCLGLAAALYGMWNIVKTNRSLIRQNRALTEQIAKDCVDRPGDISYREVLRGLIELNKNRDPQTGKPITAKAGTPARSRLTVKVLERGLARAGPVPPCITSTS